MKTTLKIKTTSFLNWYFNSGNDQEQQSIRQEIGHLAVSSLLCEGSSTITAQEIFDQVNIDVIPVNLIEGLEKTSTDIEIGDLNLSNFKIVLI